MTFCKKSLLGALVFAPATAIAHPHVFIDGSVQIVADDDNMLDRIIATWSYDEFETLYMLASMGIVPNGSSLTDTDAAKLLENLQTWPADFDGAVHVTVDDTPAIFDWPRTLDAYLLDGRIHVVYERSAATPMAITGKTIDVQMYESTYFFAFDMPNPPALTGGSTTCETEFIPFDHSQNTSELAELLLRIGRDDTPQIPDVGAKFADKAVITCE